MSVRFDQGALLDYYDSMWTNVDIQSHTSISCIKWCKHAPSRIVPPSRHASSRHQCCSLLEHGVFEGCILWVDPAVWMPDHLTPSGDVTRPQTRFLEEHGRERWACFLVMTPPHPWPSTQIMANLAQLIKVAKVIASWKSQDPRALAKLHVNHALY